jgi:hypothetical protein
LSGKDVPDPAGLGGYETDEERLELLARYEEKSEKRLFLEKEKRSGQLYSRRTAREKFLWEKPMTTYFFSAE